MYTGSSQTNSPDKMNTLSPSQLYRKHSDLFNTALSLIGSLDSIVKVQASNVTMSGEVSPSNVQNMSRVVDRLKGLINDYEGTA